MIWGYVYVYEYSLKCKHSILQLLIYRLYAALLLNDLFMLIYPSYLYIFCCLFFINYTYLFKCYYNRDLKLNNTIF